MREGSCEARSRRGGGDSFFSFGTLASVSSSKTDHMTRRVHLEVSLEPQGVVPPRLS